MDRKPADNNQRKKPQAPTVRPFTTALFVIRALQLGIPITELDYFTVGDIYDLLTESGNDREEWAKKATQEDINNFLC